MQVVGVISFWLATASPQSNINILHHVTRLATFPQKTVVCYL